MTGKTKLGDELAGGGAGPSKVFQECEVVIGGIWHAVRCSCFFDVSVLFLFCFVFFFFNFLPGFFHNCWWWFFIS